MARYYEGVNGSMQGTAGGVNVYNWRGVWLQRSRRKEVLNFKPTTAQEVVITNFADLSRFLRPFRSAFRAAIKNAPAGQTYYSVAAKTNYRIQRNKNLDPSSKLIKFKPEDIVLGTGSLGGFLVQITEGRDDTISLSWGAPTLDSPFYGGNLVVAVLGSTGGVLPASFPLDAESAQISYNSVQEDTGDTAYAFACAVTVDGQSTTTLKELN